MAAPVLTINGVTRQLVAQTLRISESVNRRNTCTFDVYLGTSGVVPLLDQEVIITHNGVRIFGGNINAPVREGFGGWGLPNTMVHCSAVDFNALIDRRVLNIAIAPGTLKAALQALDDYLTPYGVTLDAAQVTGPTLLLQHYYFSTLRRAFELLSDQTNYVFEIDYNKTLRMFLPTASAAPYNVTSSNKTVLGDIKVEPTREDFANRILILGGTGTLVVTENLTAAAGSVVLNYTLVGHAGYVTYGGNFETLDVPGMGATWEWTTTSGTTTLTRSGGGAGAIAITYTAHFPKLTTSGDSPQLWTTANLVERIVPYPDVFDVAVLQVIGDKMAARTNLERKRVTYTTPQAGVHPGMTHTMTVPERGLTGTYTITDVQIDNPIGETLRRYITAIEGDTYLMASWQDDVATWGRDMSVGGGEQVMGGAGGSLPASAAPPFKAVQYNNNGSFGGKSSFIFEAAGNSVVIGNGSTITATLFDSCFIAGLNCHITG